MIVVLYSAPIIDVQRPHDQSHLQLTTFNQGYKLYP